MTQLLLATRNAGKLAELQRLLTTAVPGVEVQGTAEGAVFDRATLDRLLDLAVTGCAELTRVQTGALQAPGAAR